MNGKSIVATVLLSVATQLCALGQAAEVLAFPGAEGWGQFATGGRAIDERGSKVYFVTRLDDCTDDNLVEGTLRWALHTGDDTPRTILFRTCGTIKLTSKLKFKHPNVSILGQSALGGGICISGANIYVSASNVIIRHVRFRAGDEADSNYSALDIENVKHVILDHCSFSWSMEENVTMYDNDSTTVQWCIVSEPLYYSRHKKGARAYGSQWGGEHSSFHHNLFAHCVSRSPRLNGARDHSTDFGAHDQFVDTEIANNVIYNWGKKEAVYGGELDAPDSLYVIKNRVDSEGNPVYDENNKVIKDTLEIITGAYVHNHLVNNYYKPGPTTDAAASGYRYFARISNTGASSGNFSKWYVMGNVMEENEHHFSNAAQTSQDKFGGDYSTINADNWYNAATTSSQKALDIQFGANQQNFEAYYTDQSTMSGLIALDDAATAYERVIANAGCLLPRRDEVDVRILAEAAGKREPIFHGSFSPTYLGVIDSQNDLKPAGAGEDWSAWPDLSMEAGEVLPTDTDNDGIPNEWETENGLNPNDSIDGAAITESGYSNLEIYLESITAKEDPELPETGYKNPVLVDWKLNVAPDGNVSIDAGTAIVAVSVYDVRGALVYRHMAGNQDHVSFQLPVTASNGVYIIKAVFADAHAQAEKIVY